MCVAKFEVVCVVSHACVVVEFDAMHDFDFEDASRKEQLRWVEMWILSEWMIWVLWVTWTLPLNWIKLN